ncbi:uncharacterized protein Z520_01506 [Fonsecaea multimorphosa CBS 102226]|uniref:Uncharacterized protein n=1 Tax=Fonsecaea multimorphosa CBS 102226 TaxID=1442371 RepID=A0A0D2KHV8_9EURO|nr:uncharacterized protein Z520_01506 [Fonsecaea multimorphosa CBS 102226]KIY03040.1 hypothetical protein Z520_01506 [Fonsecaea multimorphosa CBS 102226]OAL30535.1 hypothetical protein AYO22_01487 [Fonsecaea multimorphosa]
MGQTQSQESESTSLPKSEHEEQEFDFSQIPDDRVQALGPNSDAEPDLNPAPAPDESTGMARRFNRKHRTQALAVRDATTKPRSESKKRSRRRRLSVNSSSDDWANEATKRKSPSLRHPTDTSPHKPLKETEPETYHIYATSDTSDGDNAKSPRRQSGNTTFTAVNGASQRGTAAASHTRFHSSEDDDPIIKQAETIHAKPTPEVAVASGTNATNGETSGVPAAEMPQLKSNDKGRFLCPWADVHNCKLTFGSGKAARRHANVHTMSFRCVVCGKQMSRKDTLANHMKLHSALQIASAEASSKLNEDPEVEMPEQPQSTQPNVSNDAQTQVEDGEPPEEDSMEFTTPQEKPESKDHGHSLDVEPRSDGLEGPEIEMHEATRDADVAEDLSDPKSTSPSSVFDETENIIVKETPMPRANLKRKRDAGDGPQPQRSSPERTRKRRKGSPNSPPTSVPPNETSKPDSLKKPGVTDVLQSRQITDKIVPRLQKRQGSMDGWAQKYTPGSGLRHPTLNPKSPPSSSVKQRPEVVVPGTSQAGPSSMKSKKKDLAPTDGATGADQERSDADALEGLGRKKLRKATYATPKGKKRAEPDVDYSTPMKDSVHVEVDASHSEDDSEPVDIATSVAKRTFQERDEDEDHDPDLDGDQTTSSENDVSEVESARKANRVSKAPKSKQSGNADSLECARCHRRFANRNLLNNHLKKPRAHVGLFKCQECSEEFWASTALAEHEKDMGHGKGNGLQGRTGAFSQVELNKLNRWRDRFCEYHNISRIQFNDMMTDTMTRDKRSSWNWPFIKRAEFLKEYLGVLPNRNRRSMLRYRERNFQNVEGSRNWTAEDDNDLIRLHKELGPKWAEIAKRLTRTVDAVSQRWHHKLRYGEVDTGEWSKAEDAKFRKILDELRRDSDGNELQDYRIPWNKVSERMGTRSAQQCSNHYRARHSKKERGKWLKIGALEKSPRSTRILTPSKMELRLSGNTKKTRTSRKGLSEEYVVDDEEEGSEGPEEDQRDGEASENDKAAEDAPNEDTSSDSGSESEADVEVEDQSRSSAKDGDPTDEISRTRIPLITKTPGKTLGSSQLFEQTQANTSALKPSQTSSKKARLQESQERPSPNIPIQRRRLESRSPLEEIPVLENGDLASEEEEDEEEEDEEEEDEDENEDKSEMSGGDDDLGAAQQTDEERDTTSEGSADEDEDEDGSAEQAVDAEAVETDDDDDDDDNNDDDDDTASTDENTDGDDGDDVDEDSSLEGGDEDLGESVEHEHGSSFMDSINESAKRSRIRSSQSVRH